MNTPFHTCLLIDDNPVDIFVNTNLILRSKFAGEVITFNSTVALKLISVGAIHPDVIFMDLKMPVMSGFQFLHEYDIIDINKDNTKIFILSSSCDSEEITQVEDNKYVTRFIQKTLTTEMLRILTQ
jgi:CheY-like chemotaxis protein